MYTNYELLGKMNTEKIKKCIVALENIFTNYKLIKEGEYIIPSNPCELCTASGSFRKNCYTDSCPWVIFEGHTCIQHIPKVSLFICNNSPKEYEKIIDFRIKSIPIWIYELKQELIKRGE